jgi:hypothetical protein
LTTTSSNEGIPLIREGEQFPNFFLLRPDGTNLDLYELRKKEHALLLFVEQPNADLCAFIQRFQDEIRMFEWLKTRLIVVFRDAAKISTPWPAPSFPPFVHAQPLHEGIEWGKGYLVSLNRSLYSIYPELDLLSAKRVEDDILHWESGHCLG